MESAPQLASKLPSREKAIPATLILVGDGPERGKVEQYCRAHNICGSITFIGSFPLVEEVLVGADLFLLPSESESFGLSQEKMMQQPLGRGFAIELIDHGEQAQREFVAPLWQDQIHFFGGAVNLLGTSRGLGPAPRRFLTAVRRHVV